MSPHSRRKVKEAYKRHGLIATPREVCNTTRPLGDGSCLIPHQSVRGSARAIRAVRNTRVFQTETRVVADVESDCAKFGSTSEFWRELWVHLGVSLNQRGNHKQTLRGAWVLMDIHSEGSRYYL
jgi:hypothetical protein